MKRILFLLLAAGGALSTTAQTSEVRPTHRHLVDTTRPNPYWAPDSILSAWVVDVNAIGGMMNMNTTTTNTVGNYTDGLNLNTGNLKFENGWQVGGDVQIGYFFGRKRHWGVGTGIMYTYGEGTMSLDKFHVEYRATDFQGDTYRQVISSNGKIKETLKLENWGIPLVLKYKTRFSRRLGFTADAGVLFNFATKTRYKSDARFDYEAIYKWNNESNSFVYDNAAVPDVNDVLYTREQLASTTSTSVENEFMKLRDRGYNVGLNVPARTDGGTVTFKSGSIGFMIQPSLNVFLSDKVALNFGLYYMYQMFQNTAATSYRLTNGVGDYSSVMNTVTASNVQSYGLNVGARFFICHKAPVVSDEDAYDPTTCGGADGKIVMNGLRANKPVTVYYYKDGVQQKESMDTTNDNGSAVLDSLTSGSYDSIIVKMKKRYATAIPVALVDPALTISFESSTNPTAYDKEDGTITLVVGPHTGNSVTVNYMVDGVSKTYTGTIAGNNRVVISGLKGGNYTMITATVGGAKCTARAEDVTLITPAAPPPPQPVAPTAPVITVSTPILFEHDKTVIREDSHPIIDLAVEKMSSDKDALIVINGYTDATGKPAYNKALSLRRANAVKKELVRMGVSAKRIKVVGHGSADPAADNDTPEGRAKNRRAVMHLNVGE